MWDDIPSVYKSDEEKQYSKNKSQEIKILKQATENVYIAKDPEETKEEWMVRIKDVQEQMKDMDFKD